MLIPVLPQMQKALNISQFQSSLTISLFSIAAGLFIPILGYLSDRFSRKAIIIPSLIVYGEPACWRALAPYGNRTQS